MEVEICSEASIHENELLDWFTIEILSKILRWDAWQCSCRHLLLQLYPRIVFGIRFIWGYIFFNVYCMRFVSFQVFESAIFVKTRFTALNVETKFVTCLEVVELAFGQLITICLIFTISKINVWFRIRIVAWISAFVSLEVDFTFIFLDSKSFLKQLRFMSNIGCAIMFIHCSEKMVENSWRSLSYFLKYKHSTVYLKSGLTWHFRILVTDWNMVRFISSFNLLGSVSHTELKFCCKVFDYSGSKFQSCVL